MPKRLIVASQRPSSTVIAGCLSQFPKAKSLDPGLNLSVEQVFQGETACVPIDETVTLENGHPFESVADLGQSVAVLRKPVTRL